MSEVYSKQVIICTKGRRGNGKDIPIRQVTEVFDMDGKLIAEFDLLPVTIESMIDFLKEQNFYSAKIQEAINKKFID